jgi:hypothetical protein
MPVVSGRPRGENETQMHIRALFVVTLLVGCSSSANHATREPNPAPHDGGSPAQNTPDAGGGSGASSTTPADGGAPSGSDGGSSSEGGSATIDSPSTAGEIGPTAAECVAPSAPAMTLCEATNGAHCYYLDPTAGSDATGDGSDAKPWRSFANVVTYYGTPGELGSTARPTTAVDLKPGDYVYLRSGTYDGSYNYAGSIVSLYYRNVDASAAAIHIKAYPGQTPVIAPSVKAVAITVLGSKGFVIEDIEVKGAYQFGVWISESDAVTLRRLHVHDTDGVDNDNIAGIHFLQATHAELACSTVHDNYDRTNADTNGVATENSSNVVAFGGGSLRIHHSLFYQTPATSAPKSGGCIKYKHAATDIDAVFEVDHDILRQCKFMGVGTGTQHSRIHHNVFQGGGGIVSRDFGGPTHQTDQVFRFNSFYHAFYEAGTLDISPTSNWNDASFTDPKGFVFSDNVVVEARTAASQEVGTIAIGTYASDALYQATVPELKLERNCYMNESGPLHFALFAANGGNYGALGAQYDFAGWQAKGFDVDSVEAAPGFTAASEGNFELASTSPCATMGAYARP